MGQTIAAFGASVRGPLHERAGAPNEDAWARADSRLGSLIVVCDGLGSKPRAQLGAQAACAAAREAVARWAAVEGAPVSYLAHLIEVFWRLHIHPCDPTEAATTCLLAFAQRSGRWVVGGVGDGLALVRTGRDASVVLTGDRHDGFSNDTSGLGVTAGPKAWRLTTFPATAQARLAVLATDGVADDLIPERLDGFCEWLSALESLAPTKRWRRLVTQLRVWPTPRHLDDKTIAVLKGGAAAEPEDQQ